MDHKTFAARHRDLLQLERQAEQDEVRRLLAAEAPAVLQARGMVLLRLVAADLEPGLGGAIHAVLQPSRGGALPAHRFGPGDVVALAADGEPPTATAPTGVVTRVQSGAITVALDQDDVDLPSLLRLERLAPDVTFRRLQAALDELQRDLRGEALRLREVCFHERDPEFAPPSAVAFCDPTLDASQQAAVLHALGARQLALIHGPPGTGKTTALVELIRQCVRRGERVLACAPSNVAVDNLAERLVASGLRCVRLGHPARVAAAVGAVSLAALVDGAEEQRLLRDLRREITAGLRAVHKAKSRQDRHAARAVVRQLRREQRDLETAITRGFVDSAEVVLATTTGAADWLLADKVFDRVVVDEAAQALEAACWLPLLRGRAAVLAGDHRQLPPTILSAAAAQAGLDRTLFERLATGPRRQDLVRMLTVQYRMHAAIMGWPAATFYDGRIEAAPAVAGHLLAQLPGVQATELTQAPLWFLDTAGCGHDETPGDADGSKANPGEAAIVVGIVQQLLAAGVPANAIAVITPYNAQVQLLTERLGGVAGLEIGTVDGLQGREKEACVVSLVRSNERGELGFLAEPRRLNVALTRARRHLCIVGDSATLAHDAVLAGLVEHCQQHGDYRTAFGLD